VMQTQTTYFGAYSIITSNLFWGIWGAASLSLSRNLARYTNMNGKKKI